MSQNIHCCAIREKWELQTLSPRLIPKCSLELQLLSALLRAARFLLGWFHSLLVALLSRYPTTLASPSSWGFQDSLSQLHAMASLGLHADTHLAHIWPQQLSLVTEGESTTPFLYPSL